MGTSLSLQHTALVAAPGATASAELRVRNTGDVVDQFSFQPLGDAAAWITVEPATVRLFPDTDAVVTVTIAPPRRSSTPAGVTVWAVKAMPQEDPGGAAVAEGTIDVGEFVEIGAELQPVTGRGRMTGRFELAVDNAGNVPVPVRINGNDPEQHLQFDLTPPQIDTQPGSANFVKVRITPERRIWRGQPKNHPFQIVVEPQRAGSVDPAAEAPAVQPPIVVNGNLLQEPILPKWLLKALLVLLALMVALFVLWKTLLKPSVESAAREVAIEEIAPVSSAVAAIEPAVEEAAAQAEQAAEQAAGAEESAAAAEEAAAGGGGGGGGGALDNLFNESTQPGSLRLPLDTGIGTTNTVAGPPNPENTSFALTDIILQNPAGDIGRIRISANGVVVMESALENFRDLDFHFVAPIVVPAGQSVSIEVVCAATQIDARPACSDAVFFSGFTTTLVPATTAPAGG